MDKFILEQGKFGSVWLALTYNCNNQCKWCYASSNISSFRDREFDNSKETELYELLSELGIRDVKLVGGESTLYPNIIPLVGNLSSLGMNITLVTNGRRFSDLEFAKRITDAGLKDSCFSIEGYDKESHDAETCVRGSFVEAMQGIENFIKLGGRIATNTTITSENKGYLEKIVDFLSTKSRVITFNICEPLFRARSSSTNVFSPRGVLSPMEGVSEFERIYRYAKQRGIDIKLTTPLPICNFSEDIRESMHKEGAIGGICSIISGQNFVIDYNGDILPCTLFSGFPLFNIFKEGKVISAEEFLSRYNSLEGGQGLREKIRHFPSTKCSEGCDLFCSGGCPIFWAKYPSEEQIKGL
ncbi:MAG: radical SAM protein [Candidatus Pacearchaeota archaeon]|nr:radical SAM protein [Candidatus Pacearchaeota archaeon]